MNRREKSFEEYWTVSFGKVFNARFGLHFTVNGEPLQFFWQEKWLVKNHVFGWLVWQQHSGWTWEKRNWRQETLVGFQGIGTSGKMVKSQNVGSAEARLQSTASWGMSRRNGYDCKKSGNNRKKLICFPEA